MSLTVQHDGQVVRVCAPLISGERWIMLRTDAHRDHPCSRRELELEHLDRAKKLNAVIVDGGDLFCAMQGMNDKRRSDDKRPEHRGMSYYDRLVDDMAESLEPYSATWAVMCRGNHETGVLKYSETDLVSRLANKLRSGKSPVVACGYTTYITFAFTDKRKAYPLTMYVNHGSGGSSPVTKGVIGTARRAAYVVDADIVFTGHIHQGWDLPITQVRMVEGKPVKKLVWHIQGPGYKDVHRSRTLGYEIEKELAPSPVGCHFVRCYVGGEGRLRFDVQAAFEP